MEGTQAQIAQATVWYTVATWLTFAAILVAAGLAIRQLGTIRRDSEHNLLMGLMGNWTDEKMIKARRLVRAIVREAELKGQPRSVQAEVLKNELNRLQEANDEDFFVALLIPHYFEFASVLIGESEREKELFAKLFEESVIYYYELFEPWIGEQQLWIDKQEGKSTPGLCQEFRHLYQFCQVRRK